MNSILDNIQICYTTKDGKKFFIDNQFNTLTDNNCDKLFQTIKETYFEIDLIKSSHKLNDLSSSESNHSCVNINASKVISNVPIEYSVEYLNELFQCVDYDKFYIKDIDAILIKENQLKLRKSFFTIDFHNVHEEDSENTIKNINKANKDIIRFGDIFMNRENVEESTIRIRTDKIKFQKEDKNSRFIFLFKSNNENLVSLHCTQKEAEYARDYYKIKNQKKLLEACK